MTLFGYMGGAKIMVNSFEIHILNWEKYQGRGREWNNPTWLRIQNNLPEHELWDELSDIELRAFIYILCVVSKKGHKTGKITLNLKNASRLSSIKPQIFISTLKKLERLQIIPCGRPVESRSDPGERIATEQNTTEQNRTNTCAFDFESLYLDYPRKKGKKKGLEICEKRISNEKEFELLRRAIGNYREYVMKEKYEPRYIKHFSSFMGSWEEWIEPENQSSFDWDGFWRKQDGKGDLPNTNESP